MRRNRSMPASAVIPILGYPDVRAAVDWLGAAFGFEERLRIGDGHRSQLRAGDGDIVVREGRGGVRGGQSVMVRVEDVDAHVERARAAGARIVAEPEDFPYGERQYSAADLAGHVWTFSETRTDV